MFKIRLITSSGLLVFALILFYLNPFFSGQTASATKVSDAAANTAEDNTESADETKIVEEETESESDDSDEEDGDSSDVVFEKLLSYEKYAPKFSIKPRKEAELENFPCMDCHEDEETNYNIRLLEEDHEDYKLEHGAERFWCLTCHQADNRDYLRSLKNNAIDFDQSYRLCGQCHFQRQKDWFFGAHGKRIGNWSGERKLYLCTECHDPHSPSIKPLKPNPPPKVRKGLVFVPNGTHIKKKVWQKYLMDQTGEKHD
ncbi:MAG: hypothetical protein H8E38_07125 [SAR324 cluster bacterium]|nr:hypothetical protein [SAR324 cluster bacterium]